MGAWRITQGRLKPRFIIQKTHRLFVQAQIPHGIDPKVDRSRVSSEDSADSVELGEAAGRGTEHCWYLEDHPRCRKWLGSPLFTSHEKAIYKGKNPI